MQRLSIASLVLLLLVSCGKEASRLAEANEKRALQAEADAATAVEQAAKEAAKTALATATMLDIHQGVRDELWALVGQDVTGEELTERAEGVLWRVEQDRELLLQSNDGMHILFDSRGRAAALLADPRANFTRRALGIVEEDLAMAKAHLDDEPSDRVRLGLFGDAKAGKARVLLSLGRHLEAAELFAEAIEALELADKGRGSGTGGSEHKGEASGGGKGRGKGKGKNKVKSLALKRHIATICTEASIAYRLHGDFGKEFFFLSRERLFRGKICQAEGAAKGHRFQMARAELARTIDRLAENSIRKGEALDGVKVEQLVLHIHREVWEKVPDLPVFYEAILPQQVEVATKAANLGSEALHLLRPAVTQAFDDLKLIRNIGMPDDEIATFEAQLCLQMGRGLTKASTDEGTSETDAADLVAEAVNWYGRVVVTLDGFRGEDGGLPPYMASIEEAALIGIESIQSGG